MGMTSDKLDLSVRESRIRVGDDGDDGDDGEVRDPEICDLGGLVEGKVLRGYVKSVTDFGVYVR